DLAMLRQPGELGVARRVHRYELGDASDRLAQDDQAPIVRDAIRPTHEHARQVPALRWKRSVRQRAAVAAAGQHPDTLGRCAALQAVKTVAGGEDVPRPDQHAAATGAIAAAEVATQMHDSV